MIILVLILTIIIVFTLLLYRVFVQKIIREKNVQHDQDIQYQKELLKQAIKVQEDERERIAILVHDDIGSKLNTLSVWLNNDETWNSERSREVVSQQLPILIDSTRDISHTLYPVNLKRFGIEIALEELVLNIAPTLKISLVFNHEYSKKEIAFEVQVYRIIQEFISNSIKHGNAQEITIQLRDSTKFFCMILADNGIGFNHTESKKGMGLENISSRVKSINGLSKWKSVKNNGCRLILKIQK